MADEGQYALYPVEKRTPRGLPVTMWIRSDTSDWNTAQASMNEDEYGLAERFLSGLALDIGGYVGSVSVALALDNPDLRVICVEPVPENRELIARNLAENGLTARVTVIAGLAGHSGTGTIRYAFKGGENELHHAFVGNSTITTPEADHTALMVPSHSLSDLVGDEPVSLIKIDCEGGEYDFLDTDLSQVQAIVGERHPDAPDGVHHPRSDLLALLAGFDVTFAGPEAGPEGFRAERRG